MTPDNKNGKRELKDLDNATIKKRIMFLLQDLNTGGEKLFKTEGLFRLAGTEANIKAIIQHNVVQEEDVFSSSVSGIAISHFDKIAALNRCLRQLKDKGEYGNFYGSTFLEAGQNPTQQEQEKYLREVDLMIEFLLKEDYSIEFLKYCYSVNKSSDFNKMPIRNLAIVIAPNFDGNEPAELVEVSARSAKINAKMQSALESILKIVDENAINQSTDRLLKLYRVFDGDDVRQNKIVAALKAKYDAADMDIYNMAAVLDTHSGAALQELKEKITHTVSDYINNEELLVAERLDAVLKANQPFVWQLALENKELKAEIIARIKKGELSVNKYTSAEMENLINQNQLSVEECILVALDAQDVKNQGTESLCKLALEKVTSADDLMLLKKVMNNSKSTSPSITPLVQHKINAVVQSIQNANELVVLYNQCGNDGMGSEMCMQAIASRFSTWEFKQDPTSNDFSTNTANTNKVPAIVLLANMLTDNEALENSMVKQGGSLSALDMFLGKIKGFQDKKQLKDSEARVILGINRLMQSAINAHPGIEGIQDIIRAHTELCNNETLKKLKKSAKDNYEDLLSRPSHEDKIKQETAYGLLSMAYVDGGHNKIGKELIKSIATIVNDKTNPLQLADAIKLMDSLAYIKNKSGSLGKSGNAAMAKCLEVVLTTENKAIVKEALDNTEDTNNINKLSIKIAGESKSLLEAIQEHANANPLENDAKSPSEKRMESIKNHYDNKSLLGSTAAKILHLFTQLVETEKHHKPKSANNASADDSNKTRSSRDDNTPPAKL